MRHLGILVLFVTLLGARASADSKPGDYLTDKGELKEALDVQDLQGGIAGLVGKFWVIQPDGSYTSGAAFGKKMTVESSGKLTKEQLARLAEDLAKYDLASLKSSGKPAVNPHVVRVTSGKHHAELNLKAGEPLSKADASSIPGRFAGIVHAVKELAGKGKDAK